jgi:hypothetical protein
MALKDIADKIKKKLSGDDKPKESVDPTFPKALKSGRHYKSTYGSSVGGPSQEYPITDRMGRPELLDIENSKKLRYPATSDGRLIGARGTVIGYREDFPNMVESAEASNAEEKAALKRAIDEARNPKKETGMKKGGKVSSASSRGDGCAQRGKTKGRML